ncbi:hypothetical protein MOF11_17265 [Bacillus haynesii]|uniref:hypothetical protein n=1 Tax=Bacillus haynesii TaxID=1925021 RepID=UPI002282EF7C|nr:hypothetical protein [Bacillus haynesii]MCY9226758.1 hypothetical protein [Bacillus haynesii]
MDDVYYSFLPFHPDRLCDLFFRSGYRLQDLLFRMFDAVIVCVLAVNGLYFLQKNKGVAYVSFLLGFINMGLLIVLMIR